MKLYLGGTIHERLAWPFVALLVTAMLMLAAPVWTGQVRSKKEKSIILEMSWKRGDNHYGSNFIHLESACLSNSAPGCFCSADFKATSSKDFADYIESFGNNKVPVQYHVDYDSYHQIVGAILESVGKWPGDQFHDSERLLGTGFRMIPGQSKGGGHVRNPGDCFPSQAN